MIRDLYTAFNKDKFASFDEMMNRKCLQVEIKDLNSQEFSKRLSECNHGVTSCERYKESGVFY